MSSLRVTVPVPWRQHDMYHTATDLWLHADHVQGEGFLIPPPMQLPNWVLSPSEHDLQMRDLALTEWSARNAPRDWQDLRHMWIASMHPRHPIPRRRSMTTAPQLRSTAADKARYCVPGWLIRRFNGLGPDAKLKRMTEIATLTEAFVDHMYVQNRQYAVECNIWLKMHDGVQTEDAHEEEEEEKLKEEVEESSSEESETQNDENVDDTAGDMAEWVTEQHHCHNDINVIHSIIAGVLHRVLVLQNLMCQKVSHGTVKAIYIPFPETADNWPRGIADAVKALETAAWERWQKKIKVGTTGKIKVMWRRPGQHICTLRIVFHITKNDKTARQQWRWQFKTAPSVDMKHSNKNVSKFCILSTHNPGTEANSMEYTWDLSKDDSEAEIQAADPNTLQLPDTQQQGRSPPVPVRRAAAPQNHHILYHIPRHKAPCTKDSPYAHLRRGCYNTGNQRHICVTAPNDSGERHYSVLHHFHAKGQERVEDCNTPGCEEYRTLYDMEPGGDATQSTKDTTYKLLGTGCYRSQDREDDWHLCVSAADADGDRHYSERHHFHPKNNGNQLMMCKTRSCEEHRKTPELLADEAQRQQRRPSRPNRKTLYPDLSPDALKRRMHRGLKGGQQ